MNETKPTGSNAGRLISWLSGRSRREMSLMIGGGILVLAAAAAAVLGYWNSTNHRTELLAYRLCVGRDQGLCPSDLTFVRNEGEDTVTRWVQRQCAGYKTRRIIVSDGPSKECDCYIADVACSSE